MYDDARKDPDWIGYITDLKAGRLNDFSGQYVAYRNGKFLTSAATQSGLIKKVREEFANLKLQTFIQRVDELETVAVPTFTTE